MSNPVFKHVGTMEGVETTDPVDISHLESYAIMIGGTFVATVSVEISFDGVTWVPHANFTGKTAPIVGDGAIRTKLLRGNCTAYTSGSIELLVSGSDEG